ncbi:MAG: hypothetical protein JSS07_03625 [Proteobacteria bacterium]|nr:hypothetical protein [Pseudomonadota bacterium]
MKRLFILIQDMKETTEVAQELRSLGIKDNQIHICGGISEDIKAEHLYPANIFQTTNLGYAIKFGPLLGLGFVVLIIALCAFFFPANIKIHALGYLAILVFGIGFGIWATGLIGLGVKNPVLEKYQAFLEEGHYIMMIDTAVPEKEKEITEVVLSHHPGIKVADSVH